MLYQFWHVPVSIRAVKAHEKSVEFEGADVRAVYERDGAFSNDSLLFYFT